jgi:hypothetical protein
MPLYGYRCESYLQKDTRLKILNVRKQGLFLHLIFSYLHIKRNKDPAATVPPVRFPDIKIRVGFMVSLFSLVGRYSLVRETWAFVNTCQGEKPEWKNSCGDSTMEERPPISTGVSGVLAGC